MPRLRFSLLIPTLTNLMWCIDQVRMEIKSLPPTPIALYLSPPCSCSRTRIHTSKQKCWLIARCGRWQSVTSVSPSLLSLSHGLKDGHENTNQWSFSHPAQSLWAWIIQFVSTKAAFVIAAMCSRALYPACFALYTLIHHIQPRFQEIRLHRGRRDEGISQRSLKKK